MLQWLYWFASILVYRVDLLLPVHHFYIKLLVFGPLLGAESWLQSNWFYLLGFVFINTWYMGVLDWWMVDRWWQSAFFLGFGPHIQRVIVWLLGGFYHFNLLFWLYHWVILWRTPVKLRRVRRLGWVNGLLRLLFANDLVISLILSGVGVWNVEIGEPFILVNGLFFYICWCLYSVFFSFIVFILINDSFLWILNGHSIGRHGVNVSWGLVDHVEPKSLTFIWSLIRFLCPYC